MRQVSDTIKSDNAKTCMRAMTLLTNQGLKTSEDNK